MTRRHIVLIAYMFPPDNYVGALRPARFAKYLRRLGHEVTVVAAGQHMEPAIEQGYVHRTRGDSEDYAPTVTEKIARKVLGSYSWGAEWVFRAGAYTRGLVTSSSVVLSTAPPIATHVLGAYFKSRLHCRWIADCRDPLFDGRKGLSARVAKRAEAFLLGYADIVIANTDAVADSWKGQYPQYRQKVVVLGNGFDPEERLEPKPIPLRSFRVLTHVGSLYGTRSPDCLLRGLRALVESGLVSPGSLRLRLVGPFEDGVTRIPETVAMLEECGGLEVVRTKLPLSEAHDLMATSDYLVLIDLLEGPTAGLHVPAKLFEYVQVGRPILLCALPDAAVSRVLAMSGIPHVIMHPGDSVLELQAKRSEERR